MCIHNACDTESLCACCRRYGPDHDASACTPITQQLRAEADTIRKLWKGNEPAAWNQSAWHRWMKDLSVVEMLEKAASEIETQRRELVSLTNKLTAERDEARRRLCDELLESEGNPFGWKGARGAAGIAERLGWDCFKEVQP